MLTAAAGAWLLHTRCAEADLEALLDAELELTGRDKKKAKKARSKKQKRAACECAAAWGWGRAALLQAGGRAGSSHMRAPPRFARRRVQSATGQSRRRRMRRARR